MGQKSATSLHRSNLALIRHCEEGRRSNQSAAELDEVNLFIIQPDCHADARNDEFSKNYHADARNDIELKDCLFKSRRDL